jgi:hypothetical protein
MDLVDSIPEYTAILRHCPNVIRAIVSIQADAFDCSMLYQALATRQCSTCERFGDHLYLVSCRRACYFCFTRRLEYLPLTLGQALKLASSPDSRTKGCHSTAATRRRIYAAKPPSILSLPGRYSPWASESGNKCSSQRRLQLLDRPVVARALASSDLLAPRLDRTTSEPRRYMAIITAPFLFGAGRQADWGYFCLACGEEKEEETKHFRIKYTTEGLLEQAALYGPAKEMPNIPGRYVHDSPS